MNATPKTHAVQVRRAAEHRAAVVTDVRRLAFTSETGVVRPERQWDAAPRPVHTLSGYSDDCACEKWADCYYCGTCNPD